MSRYRISSRRASIYWKSHSMPRMLWHREKDFRKRENQMSENLLPCPSSGVESFQKRVDPWMQECFGPEISSDIVERNHRFLEEALELVQSTGCTKHEANQLVEYVFSRPVGETPQEAGRLYGHTSRFMFGIKNRYAYVWGNRTCTDMG
jgi:hypothetical protein